MEEKKTRYITTTLPYVNADPHIGFGLEIIQADTLARYWRLLGHEVFFNTGTDEHGQKIAEKADQKGEDRQAYVDHFAAEFNKLKEALNLSYDNFVRTTDKSHEAAARTIWEKCQEAGDIYKKKYKGLYCVGCEMYLRESDLVDGKCPSHPNQDPEEIEEENYFFALSKYQSYLEEYLSRPNSVTPEWRREEALKFVKGGLEDFSISREKERLNWGVEVPDDEDQVMYVWFDALTNYISTLGWPSTLSSADASETEEGKPATLSSETEEGKPEDLFKKFWEEGETLQLAGKDQVRFQSIMWQAMLKSAGVKATDTVFYHGFINSDGQKMSKSIGNVISPYEMVEKYGTDATRYILLRHVHPIDDSDLTWEKMDEYYTANLVNGIGNLTARVLKMAESYEAFPENIAEPELPVSVANDMDKYEFQQYMDKIWSCIGDYDQVIADTEPFKLYKTDPEKAREIVSSLVTALLEVAVMLKPVMPETSEKITAAINENKKPENLFNRLPE